MTIQEMKIQIGEIESIESYSDCSKACRTLLQDCIEYIFAVKNKQKPKNATLLELVECSTVTSFINDSDIVRSIDYVRTIGMHAEQGRPIRKKEAELALGNISYFVDFLEAKEKGIDNYHKPPYMSEANTRRLYIDEYLREAGWDIVEKENIAMPDKAGIEIRVEGMPNDKGFGFCDYVLYGDDGKPLAIVEAKKTSVSPETGRHQVDLYAECMEKEYGYKPIKYYTNGYEIKIVDGIYPDRSVVAFHSRKELKRMLDRRTRGDIVKFDINDDITNRPYQKIAITKICEAFNAKRRRGLLVMATGTGKTRVAISLVDILTKNNWIKNVLFLADRTTLVNQAKRNFSKLMPDMSVCELSGSGEKDYDARLMFCTYQSMIKYIDAEDKRFTTGRFDLIIIDEAHRSIFNRYGTIFRYFDSLLVGLTATPKDEVDANTYKIFGCEAGIPNYDYTLDDAIKEKYLVGYSVINRTSKMLNEGIKYDDLTDDQKEQLDEYYDDDPPTPDFNIPGNELFKFLFNIDTCKKVLEELMTEGLRVEGGETLGKTIIFAYNHKHAQMIVDCFQELYPEYPDNTCQLVDYSVSYGENLVIKFEEDPEFRIAVSVDMLDTGVDVPAVLNLVFFKKVRSKIKFVQMIGRGTRLCEDIYGPGKNKSGFKIFDYCGNFEFFGENPDGKSAKETLTLSQRRFNIRMDMLFELQRLEYQQDERMLAYYEAIKSALHKEVVLVKSHDKRIQVRESMQYVDKYYDLETWTSLSPVMVKEAKNHISPLLDSGLGGDYAAVAFDVRMFYIEHSLLKTGTLNEAIPHIKTVRLIAQYLINEKASVPQVREKASILLEFVGDDYWYDPTIEQLEESRTELRGLMQFLKGRGRKKFDIDIPDDIEESDYQPDDTTIDIRTYREKVIDYLVENSDRPVIQKIYNLEPINDTDIKELELVLWHDLGTQEDYSKTTSIGNLAAFIRSLIGLNQEAINKKFGEYINGNKFNSQQQEFVLTIINYVRENGDIELSDIVNNEPFNNYDLNDMFGVSLTDIVAIVNTLHNCVVAEVA